MKNKLIFILLLGLFLTACNNTETTEVVEPTEVDVVEETETLEDQELDNQEPGVIEEIDTTEIESVEDTQNETVNIDDFVIEKTFRISNEVNNLRFMINGEIVNLDEEMIIENNILYLPAESVGNVLGMNVRIEESSLEDDYDMFYLVSESGREILVNPRYIISSDGVVYMDYRNEDYTPNAIEKDGKFFAPINHFGNSLHMNTVFNENENIVGLVDIEDTETYPVVFMRYQDGNVSEVNSSLEVEWRDGNYMIVGTDETFENRVDSIYESDYSYDEITSSEEYFYGSNFFSLDSERTEIIGFMAE